MSPSVAKLTVHDTPSEQALAKAAESFKLTDDKGSIVIKSPGVLAQYRLIEVCGESAKNEVYMGMVLPLIYVVEIDGDAVAQPANKLQLEALIARLDTRVETVIAGVAKHFGKPDPEADKAAVKK
jgi:hypothetical protein